MTRVLFLQFTTALPARTASAVIYCSSLTRIPVPQMVWITSDNRVFPAAFTSRWYSAFVNSLSSRAENLPLDFRGRTQQSCNPRNRRKRLSANQHGIDAGRRIFRRQMFLVGDSFLLADPPSGQDGNQKPRISRRYFSIVAALFSSVSKYCSNRCISFI